MKRTAQCEQCFSKYCWDGKDDDENLICVEFGNRPSLATAGTWAGLLGLEQHSPNLSW